MQRGLSALLALGVMTASLGLTMCGGGGESGSTSSNPCPQGICGGGGAGGATTGTGATGGTSSTSTGTSTSTSTGTSMSTGTSGCVEAWVCSPWDGQGTDNGTRTCVDQNNCGTTTSKPVETAQLPDLDLEYFKCKVQPILDKKCSQMGCHGTEVGRSLRVYARARLRDDTSTPIDPSPACAAIPKETSANCIGWDKCACVGPLQSVEWQRNYDAARGFMLDAQGNPIPAGQADTSDLIQEPIVGGKSHAGVHLFKPNDADHQNLKAWLGGAQLGMTCVTNGD